jgi:hypothetical protein
LLKLIYYKIGTPKGFEESNEVIEINGNKMSKNEWHKFNMDMRDKHDTVDRPIIINIMDIQE